MDYTVCMDGRLAIKIDAQSTKYCIRSGKRTIVHNLSIGKSGIKRISKCKFWKTARLEAGICLKKREMKEIKREEENRMKEERNATMFICVKYPKTS